MSLCSHQKFYSLFSFLSSVHWIVHTTQHRTHWNACPSFFFVLFFSFFLHATTVTTQSYGKTENQRWICTAIVIWKGFLGHSFYVLSVLTLTCSILLCYALFCSAFLCLRVCVIVWLCMRALFVHYGIKQSVRVTSRVWDRQTHYECFCVRVSVNYTDCFSFLLSGAVPICVGVCVYEWFHLLCVVVFLFFSFGLCSSH